MENKRLKIKNNKFWEEWIMIVLRLVDINYNVSAINSFPPRKRVESLYFSAI